MTSSSSDWSCVIIDILLDIYLWNDWLTESGPRCQCNNEMYSGGQERRSALHRTWAGPLRLSSQPGHQQAGGNTTIISPSKLIDSRQQPDNPFSFFKIWPLGKGSLCFPRKLLSTLPSVEGVSDPEILFCIVPSSVIAPWKAGERVLNDEVKQTREYCLVRLQCNVTGDESDWLVNDEIIQIVVRSITVADENSLLDKCWLLTIEIKHFMKVWNYFNFTDKI